MPFSSWGPTDDCRVKPDIVASGEGLFSCTGASDNSYATYMGTSQAAPSVSGSINLLARYFETTHGGSKPRSSTMKAVVIHTADEAGPYTGPDFRTGWGLMNTEKAADIIKAESLFPIRIYEGVLIDGDTNYYHFILNEQKNVRVTIAWTDPPGTPPPPSLDNATPMLVNDLDLRIIHVSSDTTYYPWTLENCVFMEELDPISPPPTKGDSWRNNVERLDIDDDSVYVEPGLYRVMVSHKGSLSYYDDSYGQYYSIVFSEPVRLGPNLIVCPDGTGDFTTIQSAIDAVAEGDTVVLCDAVFTGEGNRDLDFDGKSITIRSQSRNPEACIIDCGGAPANPHRGFYFHSGEDSTSVLEGVTITNGWLEGSAPGSEEHGAGIYCKGSSPTFINCMFYDNKAGLRILGVGMCCDSSASPKIIDCTFSENASEFTGGGGGLYCFNSAPTLSNCTFSDNTTSNGGGMACYYSSSPVLTDCIFTSNSGSEGGGMYSSDSSPTLINCTFSGNSGDNGGGMYCDEFSPTLTSCIFSNNSATLGGGMYSMYSSPILTSCVFYKNSATNWGGGMICINSSPSLGNCTFLENSASAGGGIRNISSSTTLTLENTIIAFSSEGEAIYCEDPNTTTLICCDIYLNTGGDWVGCIASQKNMNGNMSEDPLFCNPNPMYQDFTLSAGSPCLPGNNSCGILIGAYDLGCDNPVSISPQGGAIKYQLMLKQNFPNPFNPTTTISFSLPERTDVTLSIFNIEGKLVKTLINGVLDAGHKKTSWDSTDSHGNPVSTGVYFYRLKVVGKVLTKKMVLLK